MRHQHQDQLAAQRDCVDDKGERGTAQTRGPQVGRSVGHSVQREEHEQQLRAAERPEQAVEPGQPPLGPESDNEAVEQEAAGHETQPGQETVRVIRSGGQVVGCNYVRG